MAFARVYLALGLGSLFAGFLDGSWSFGLRAGNINVTESIVNFEGPSTPKT